MRSDQGQEEWGGGGGHAHLNCLGAGMSSTSHREGRCSTDWEPALYAGQLHLPSSLRLRLKEPERCGHASLHVLAFLEENWEVIYVLAFQSLVL